MKNQKKIISVVMLSVLLVLAMGGCAMISDTEITRTDSSQTSMTAAHTEDQNITVGNAEDNDTAAENAADDYLAVLTENKPFIYYPADLTESRQFLYYADQEAAEPMKLSGILDVFNPDDDFTQIYEFAVLDLDTDGENEVLLKVISVAGDSGGYMILRRQSGEVHGYTGNYKEFMNLKTDGTFRYITLARPDDGIGTVRFYEKGYRIISLAGSETSEDLETTTYQVDQKSVTKEEYFAAVERHDAKTDAVWHRFTDENIYALFSSSL